MKKAAFTIYPAIDILGGNCVRLYKGDYDRQTIYGSPIEMGKRWELQGAEWLHLVDLDGAKQGQAVNHKVIEQIAAEVRLKLQVGGGIRTMQQVEAYLESGVERVILGTAAIKDPLFVKQALKRFGEQIVIGIDAKEGKVATEGWIEASTISALELIQQLVDAGARHVIFTDISRDGTLEGPNMLGTLELAKRSGVSVIASGGVSSLADIQQLAALAKEGITGVIVGKALYEPSFTLAEALEAVGEVGESC